MRLCERVPLVVVLALSAVLNLPAAEVATDSAYYKVLPIFIPYPVPGKTWVIKNYGPVGIGLDLISPAFTMRINNVEKGSPAEAAGNLKKGQIVESINGTTLKDIDPRVQLADILGKAEATDGVMKLKIQGEGEVVVKLPVLGAYSTTWPLNCPKSDRIIRNFADRVAKLETPDWSAAPFLLSTGEEKDLDVVRRWLKVEVPYFEYPWHIGYKGTALCEYYLRTGDASVIPSINKMAAKLKASMYNGSWMGRGSETPNFKYMAGGHMNAAGVHALNFILLAKECGADVDEYLLQRVLFQFYRFAGHGNVAYGDQLPEGGFRDNGKTAGLAVAMSSAASLDPKGEASVYAKARDNSAMKSFYATTWFNRAHTGGGIGEIWHGVAMQLLVDEKPVQYRSFMDERRWFYELSRRFDGSFGIADGERYDTTEWGNYFAMAYTASRKKLRMFGAPKTQWCKTYTLPDRPWGTVADDVFQSNTAAEITPGKVMDFSKETILNSASGPINERLGTNATDKVLLIYAHHPDFGIRSGIAGKIVSMGRNHLIVPLLKSKDPRVRDVGVLTIAGMFKGSPVALDVVTDEMWSLIASMINDPEESRWVAMNAMTALARAPQDKILPLVDRLLYFLKQDDWWLQSAALKPLTLIVADERVYQKVLPVIGDMLAKNTASCAPGAANGIPGQLGAAKPNVQKFALAVFTKTYNTMPDPLKAPGGADLSVGSKMFRDTVREWIKALPGGPEEALKMPKLSSAWQTSRKDSDKYIYNGFAPNKAIEGNWVTVDEVNSVKDFENQLAQEAAEQAKMAEAKKAGKPIKKKPEPKKKSYAIGSLELKDGGAAGVGRSKLLWSGNKLIESSEVLEMSVHVIDGKEYLFVETGGFSAANPADWCTTYYVMARKK